MTEAIAAGWYPDPDDGGASDRYWDGDGWTDHTRSAEAEPDIPAGWYPDPDDDGISQRYWDGDDWTDHTRPTAGTQRPPPVPTVQPPARTTEGGIFGAPEAARVLKTTTVVLNVIFLMWVIATGGSGVALFLWAAVDLILGMLWLVARLTKSECPVCGTPVRRDAVECNACGYAFDSDVIPFADVQH